MIEITRDLKDIVCCSLRYALGRKTYITSLVSDYIIDHPELIDERVKDVMLKDIEEYLDRRNIYYKDDECDYRSWLRLKEWLESR